MRLRVLRSVMATGTWGGCLGEGTSRSFREIKDRASHPREREQEERAWTQPASLKRSP